MLDGRRVRYSLETCDKQLANTKRTEIEYKLVMKILKLPCDITYDALCQEYLDLARVRLAPETYVTVQKYLSRFGAMFKVNKISEITPSMIQEFLLTLNDGKPAPKTWNNSRSYLHTLLKHAVEYGYTTENPVSRVRRMKDEERKIRFIEEQTEIDEIIKLFESDILKNLVPTAIYAGLRRSELCWLTWDDIDFRYDMIDICEKTVSGEYWKPKTRKNRRIPMSSKLRVYLVNQRSLANGEAWVFLSPEGCRWDADNLSHRIGKICYKSGFKYTLLDFRHTFGSQLAMNGKSLYMISKWMGNSPQVCAKHYAALLPEKLHRDIEF